MSKKKNSLNDHKIVKMSKKSSWNEQKNSSNQQIYRPGTPKSDIRILCTVHSGRNVNKNKPSPVPPYKELYTGTSYAYCVLYTVGGM